MYMKCLEQANTQTYTCKNVYHCIVLNSQKWEAIQVTIKRLILPWFWFYIMGESAVSINIDNQLSISYKFSLQSNLLAKARTDRSREACLWITRSLKNNADIFYGNLCGLGGGSDQHPRPDKGCCIRTQLGSCREVGRDGSHKRSP